MVAETCQYGLKASVNPGVSPYFHMFQRVSPTVGKSYTYQGSYKFLTGEEECILKVGAFDMQELSLPNTPAVAGTWQKFTVTFYGRESLAGSLAFDHL